MLATADPRDLEIAILRAQLDLRDRQLADLHQQIRRSLGRFSEPNVSPYVLDLATGQPLAEELCHECD